MKYFVAIATGVGVGLALGAVVARATDLAEHFEGLADGLDDLHI